MPLVAGVCGTARKCLNVCNPLLGFTFNAPSDSDGDLPLIYSALLERFLGILIELPKVSLDNGAPCSLAYRRSVIGGVFPLEMILFIERVFVHWIFVV